MKVAKDIYLVGAGDFGLSHEADCHVFLIDCGNIRVLIDAGVGIRYEDIINNIREDGFDPKSIDIILITHSHADHAGGAKFLKEYTGAELVAPKKEANFIENGGKDFYAALDLAKSSKIYPKDYKFEHVKVDRVIGHNHKIFTKKYTLRSILIPGHSHGTTAYLIEEDPITLFSSDIVFLNGTIGLGNWPGCDLNVYRKYIRRLSNLRVQRLFPGHFGWTLRNGQLHLNQAIRNLNQAWVPPAWTHLHPHR